MGTPPWKMMKQGFLLLCVVVLAQATNLKDTQWEQFKAKYMKDYEPEEESTRKTIWTNNHAFIKRHNEAYEAGNETYAVGENEYTDLTNMEFASMLTSMQGFKSRAANEMFVPQHSDVRSEVDWRNDGYVTPVKNQGQCGSCWAFSTTGSLEGQWFKKTGELISFSEQNLLDCSSSYGNMGCNGGLMDPSFHYIKDHGIATEEAYPYKAHKGSCHYDESMSAASVTGWKDIRRGSEEDLKAAVSEVGPISVAIDASHAGFQMYKHGVYHSIFCSHNRLNHAVLAVGYGEENGAKYWLVKNSWGKSWGNHGYINMSRDRNNNCGIATSASYPLV